MLQSDKKKRLKWKQKFLKHTTGDTVGKSEVESNLGANPRSGANVTVEQSFSPSTFKSYGSPSDYDSIFTGSLSQFSSGGLASPPVGDYSPRSHSTGNADLYQASLSLQGITTGNMNRGPKIKPYIFTQAHQPTSQRISNVNETKCFICEELLQTKLQHERLIELKCGDFIHGECFEVSINCGIDKLTKTENFTKLTSKNMEQIFPFCKGTNCKHTERKIVPVEQSLIDKLFTNALINQEKIAHTRTSNFAVLNSTLNIKTPETQKGYDWTNATNINTPRSVKAFKATPLRSPPSIPYFRFSRYSLRSSSIDRMSLSPSPNSSVSTINTLSMKMSNHKNFSTEVLKNEFVWYLIDNCKGFNLATLLKLGELRLLDNLLVSYDGLNFAPKIVYLFEKYLLAWNLNDTDLVLFPIKDMKIETINPSILKLTGNSSSLAHIWLNSETSSIIEKWVVATSDSQFAFPNDIITSTLTFPSLNDKEDISPKDNVLLPPENSSSLFIHEESDSTINLIDLGSSTSEKSPKHPMAEDDNQVLSLNNNKIDSLFKFHTNMENTNDDITDDDSDEDSDQELINELIKSTEIASKMTTLNDLLNTIDNALIESKS